MVIIWVFSFIHFYSAVVNVKWSGHDQSYGGSSTEYSCSNSRFCRGYNADFSLRHLFAKAIIGASCTLYVHRQKKESEAIETIMQLEDDGLLLSMSMKDVRNRIKGGNNAGDTYAFFEEVIAQMKNAGQIGNARVYSMVYNSIKKFGGKQDFPLRQITFRWLKKYESWYLSRIARTGKPNSMNGLAVNLRTLRALMNRAIKSNLLAQEDYPFRNYQIQRKKTRNRAIGPDDIRKIAYVDEGLLTVRQKRAKTYFLVSFYLMGISFVDLAFLKVRNIVKGRVDYKRRKTGRQHSIKITEPLLKLLEPHLDGKQQNDFIFGIVKGETEEDRYTAIRTELKRYNTALKQIGQMVGVEMNLTSYIARPSSGILKTFEIEDTAKQDKQSVLFS